ncbi:hypothetical protein ACU4GD_30505 [Cupriavidus basilensis]
MMDRPVVAVIILLVFMCRQRPAHLRVPRRAQRGIGRLGARPAGRRASLLSAVLAGMFPEYVAVVAVAGVQMLAGGKALGQHRVEICPR